MEEARAGRKYIVMIKHFPQKKTITERKAFFGPVNQVAIALYASKEMGSFRELLKLKIIPSEKLYWNAQLQAIFPKAKCTMLKEVVYGPKTYDSQRKTCLATSWSRTGICHTLLQKIMQMRRHQAKLL